MQLRYEDEKVGLIKKGISWETDRESKFNNPQPVGGDLCAAEGAFFIEKVSILLDILRGEKSQGFSF